MYTYTLGRSNHCGNRRKEVEPRAQLARTFRYATRTWHSDVGSWSSSPSWHAIRYLRARRDRAGGNSALLSVRESSRGLLDPRECSRARLDGGERSIGSCERRAPCGKVSLPSPPPRRDERKLFNRVSCSRRCDAARFFSLLLFSPLLLALLFTPSRFFPRAPDLVTSFLFSSFPPPTRPTETNRRHRGNLDDPRSRPRSPGGSP